MNMIFPLRNAPLYSDLCFIIVGMRWNVVKCNLIISYPLRMDLFRKALLLISMAYILVCYVSTIFSNFVIVS